MIPSLLTDTVTVDLERAVHYALLWGLEGLELRAVGGVHDRVPFINESMLRNRLIESDLPVVAVEPGLFAGDASDRAARLNDLALLDESVGFCRRVGCPRIVVSSFRNEDEDVLESAADLLARAALKASRAGLEICVLNEADGAVATGRRLANLLVKIGKPALTAAWSPAEALLAGEDPAEGVRELCGHIGLIRCRNVGREGNAWRSESIDTGEIDWLDQIRCLARAGFRGPLSLEVGGEPKPKWGLHDSTALIRSIRNVKRESQDQKQ